MRADAVAPHVSVVVPVHDAEPTLASLLASLAGQDCEERYEVIVSDDASTDGGAAIARRFARELPVVLCEATQRRGAGPACNAGVARATGEILAFCDADDVAHEAWLRALCEATGRHGLVAGAVHHLSVPDRRIEPATLTAYYGHLPWSMTANLALRRDVFEAAGGFAEELGTGYDADLCWRLAAQGVALAHAPEAIVFKRHREGAAPTFRQYLGYGRDHPLLYRRHRDAGMPRRSMPEAAGRYAGTAASVARALRRPRSPATLDAAARCGQDLGRLVGSVRWRSLYL